MATMSNRICKEWPADLDWTGLEVAILESAAEITLLPANEAEPHASGFPVGRAFGEGREIRWRKRAAGWHFVMIDDGSGELAERRGLEEIAPAGETKYFLWGEKEAGKKSFYTGRIPRVIDEYGLWAGGVETSGRMCLAVKQYAWKGQTIERLCRLEPADE